ncbi:hypothetical protein V3C99_014601 [Haemonchus contortus]
MPVSTIASQEDNVTNEDASAKKNKYVQWITSQVYYHGFIPRQDVVTILTKHGDFLIRSTETTHTTKAAKEVRRKISPIICVMLDPENLYENADESARLEMVRNLIIHLKSEKVYLDPKMKFDNPAEMFDYYNKNSFTINNKEIFLTRGIGLTDWEFEHKSVQVGKIIGRGQFGEVRRGKLTLKTGAVVFVAIKSIKTDANISKDLIKEVMKEARLMRGLQHPNVVNLYGVGMLDQPLYILLEYVAGGALKTYLRKNKDSITKPEKIQMALGAAWGIEYLHRVNILHRDIAARNCLYDHDSAVKISDFGLSRSGSEYKMITAKKMPVKWMAPESILNFLFTRKTDVYSFGVLVYEIWSSKDPYGDAPTAQARKNIIEGKLCEFPSDAPGDLVKYVKEKMWNKNPEQREQMDKICTWFENYAGLNAVSFVEETTIEGQKQPSRKKKTTGAPSPTKADKKKHQVFKKLRKQNKSYQGAKKDGDSSQERAEK